jgi:hypothetical protein
VADLYARPPPSTGHHLLASQLLLLSGRLDEGPTRARSGGEMDHNVEDSLSRTDPHRLHAHVDAELQEEAAAAAATERAPYPDSELQAYLARLRNLRDAVVAMEAYEDSLGEL